MEKKHITTNNPFFVAIKHFLLNNPIYKGVLVLGSGTVLAQLIGIVTMPIVTRLYTPSDFGIVTTYASVLAIVTAVTTFRYASAYPLPKLNETAANLFALCMIILVATTTGFSLILLIWGDILIDTFKLAPLDQYFPLLIVGFVGTGLYSTLNFWAIRQRDYKSITYTKINQSASGAVSKIFLGVLSYGPIGLIVGQILSQAAGIGTFSRDMWAKERDNLKKISFSGIVSVAKEYRSFPTFNLPATIVNTLSFHLPALLILGIYDSQVLGLYALAHGLVVLPGSAISSSLTQAYLGEVSKMARDGAVELRSFYIKTLRHLSLIAIPLIGIPALCAPFVVSIVFGEAWVDAGWFCLPLALMTIPQFIASPTSKLPVYGYNHWMFIWEVTRVIGVISGFYISKLFEWTIIMTLTVYALVMLIMYIVNIGLNLKAISNCAKFSRV